VQDLVDAGQGSAQAHGLWWAPARTSWSSASRRNGHPISFRRFTKYGSVVAVVTIAVSWAYLWLRYYASPT
jgi:hypothetical protein